MRRFILFISLVLLAFVGCRTDYDIADVAPAEFLESGEHHHDEHTDGETGDEHSIDEHVEASHAGHNHAAGTRNHGTQWFFNQPWAAPFIWRKLFRDAVVFLALAIAIFFITGRKRKR